MNSKCSYKLATGGFWNTQTNTLYNLPLECSRQQTLFGGYDRTSPKKEIHRTPDKGKSFYSHIIYFEFFRV